MMGLFGGLLGNASQKDIEKTERQLEDILTTTENVELAFSLIRDLIVFTDKRLILVDKSSLAKVTQLAQLKNKESRSGASVLPHTGQASNALLTVAGVISALGAAGLSFRSRKKEE